MATCPKCGAPRLAESTDCPECGVIYAKADRVAAVERQRKMEEAKVDTPSEPPPEPVRKWTSSPEINAQIDALGQIDHFLTRKEIKYLPEVLRKDEKILAITSGLMDGKSWLMVVTSSRLLFVDKGLIGGLSQTDIHIKNISSISHSTGLVFGEITVTVSGADKKVKNIVKQHVGGVVKTITDLIHKRDQESRAVKNQEAPTQVDIANQLEKLAVLMEKGILTREEFQAQKAKLLQ